MWTNFLKNTFEWIAWVNLIVEDLFILQPYEKVNSSRNFVKDFNQKFEKTSGYLLPKCFLYDQKTYFSICLLLDSSIVKRIFHEKKEVSKLLGGNLKTFVLPEAVTESVLSE